MPLHQLRFARIGDISKYIAALEELEALPIKASSTLWVLDASELMRWSFPVKAHGSAPTPTVVCVHGFEHLEEHPDFHVGELTAFESNLEWARSCTNRNLTIYLLLPRDFHVDIGCGGLSHATKGPAIAHA